MTNSGGATRIPTVEDIVSDARWFPTDLAASTATYTFHLIDRTTIEGLAGLADAAWDPSGLPSITVPLSELEGCIPSGPKPKLNFIWHTAYCCSTLLSRLLDAEDRNLSIREPKVLVALANAKRRGFFGRRETEALPSVTFHLIARPIPPGTSVTVKPATAVNYLIRDTTVLTEGRMLILFSDLATFLVSIVRNGEQRRTFNRRLFALIAADGNEQYRWSREKIFELSDLQVAALVWHMHIAEFARSLPMIEPGRVAALDCQSLLEDPQQTLDRVDRFLQLGLGPSRIQKVLEGPLTRFHAKQPGDPYSVPQRQSDLGGIARKTKEDVEAVIEWSYEVCRSTPGVGPPLPNCLTVLDKDYRRLSF
jgi:hypothetical protein